ncbi:MAG: ADP-ribosylglycohydrolase family protein [Candidatus Hermodarchaeota archaeon]
MGLALGDSLGMPIEFDSLDTIHAKYGLSGVTSLSASAQFTDDTEMTLAVTRALIRLTTVERILKTDPDEIGIIFAEEFIEWMKNPGFAPGNTCMSSVYNLKRNGVSSWKTSGKNNSKGCGTVMRAAPIGIWFAEAIKEELKYQTGPVHQKLIEISSIQSRITHGHQSATASALAGSYAVSLAYHDISPREIIEPINTLCSSIHPDFQASLKQLQEVIAADQKGEFDSEAEAIETLGQGWVAEEAFVMALYSVIKHPTDFIACLTTAVNHSGDSDSVGCIAGSIIGTLNGIDSMPIKWIEQLQEHQRVEDCVNSVLNILKKD